MLIVVFNICLIRTLLLFMIVPHWQEVRGVAVCYPVTWTLTAIGMMIVWRRELSRIE